MQQFYKALVWVLINVGGVVEDNLIISSQPQVDLIGICEGFRTLRVDSIDICEGLRDHQVDLIGICKGFVDLAEVRWT